MVGVPAERMGVRCSRKSGEVAGDWWLLEEVGIKMLGIGGCSRRILTSGVEGAKANFCENR